LTRHRVGIERHPWIFVASPASKKRLRPLLGTKRAENSLV
jgi:hypothetical protein